METQFLTTPKVAELLGVSIRRVQQLINAGRLPSQQFGREHLIKESDLALVAERKTGRPRKDGEAQNAANGSNGTKATAKTTGGKKAIKNGKATS